MQLCVKLERCRPKERWTVRSMQLARDPSPQANDTDIKRQRHTTWRCAEYKAVRAGLLRTLSKIRFIFIASATAEYTQFRPCIQSAVG